MMTVIAVDACWTLVGCGVAGAEAGERARAPNTRRQRARPRRIDARSAASFVVRTDEIDVGLKESLIARVAQAICIGEH
jgi:hypothetical protein